MGHKNPSEGEKVPGRGMPVRSVNPFGQRNTRYDPKTGKYIGIEAVLPQKDVVGTPGVPLGSGDDPLGEAGSGFAGEVDVPNSTTGNNETVEVTVDFSLNNIAFGDDGDIQDLYIQWREKFQPVPVTDENGVETLHYRRHQTLASQDYHEDDPVGGYIRLGELKDVAVDEIGIAEGHGIKWNATTERFESGAVSVAAADPGTNVEILGPVVDEAVDDDVLGLDPLVPVEGEEDSLATDWTLGDNVLDTNGDEVLDVAGNPIPAGIKEWVVSRIAYDNTGDKILYQMMRKRTYDVNGQLYSISKEHRVVVDTPVEHT